MLSGLCYSALVLGLFDLSESMRSALRKTNPTVLSSPLTRATSPISRSSEYFSLLGSPVDEPLNIDGPACPSSAASSPSASGQPYGRKHLAHFPGLKLLGTEVDIFGKKRLSRESYISLPSLYVNSGGIEFSQAILAYEKVLQEAQSRGDPDPIGTALRFAAREAKKARNPGLQLLNPESVGPEVQQPWEVVPEPPNALPAEFFPLQPLREQTESTQTVLIQRVMYLPAMTFCLSHGAVSFRGVPVQRDFLSSYHPDKQLTRDSSHLLAAAHEEEFSLQSSLKISEGNQRASIGSNVERLAEKFVSLLSKSDNSHAASFLLSASLRPEGFPHLKLGGVVENGNVFLMRAFFQGNKITSLFGHALRREIENASEDVTLIKTISFSLEMAQGTLEQDFTNLKNRIASFVRLFFFKKDLSFTFAVKIDPTSYREAGQFLFKWEPSPEVNWDPKSQEDGYQLDEVVAHLVLQISNAGIVSSKARVGVDVTIG